MTARSPSVAAVGGVGALFIAAVVVVGWLSFGSVDSRSDWELALDAVRRVSAPGDVVFVDDPQIELPPGACVRGPPSVEDVRGFARVLAVRPAGRPAPATAEIHRYGQVELAVWRPDPERLVATEGEVFGAASLAVVRGAVRLDCASRPAPESPFACDRAGGLHPVTIDGDGITLHPAPTGIVELTAVHPAGASSLEITARQTLSFDARRGLGAGVVTLRPAQVHRVGVRSGGDLVVGVGPRQGGAATWRWWGPGVPSGALDGGCARIGADAREVDRAAALDAYRRAAGGLGCALLRTPAKPAR